VLSGDSSGPACEVTTDISVITGGWADRNPVRKTPLLSNLCIQTIILPRQARDKHREGILELEEMRFVQGVVGHYSTQYRAGTNGNAELGFRTFYQSCAAGDSILSGVACTDEPVAGNNLGVISMYNVGPSNGNAVPPNYNGWGACNEGVRLASGLLLFIVGVFLFCV
jgi:hypothetical protein